MKESYFVDQDTRYNLVACKVTLNDTPAVVSGVKCDFAMVRSLDGCMSVEYAWTTVKHIIEDKGGKFKA